MTIAITQSILDRAAQAVYQEVELHSPRCDELCPPNCPGPTSWAEAPSEVRRAAYRVADAVIAALEPEPTIETAVARGEDLS